MAVSHSGVSWVSLPPAHAKPRTAPGLFLHIELLQQTSWRFYVSSREYRNVICQNYKVRKLKLHFLFFSSHLLTFTHITCPEQSFLASNRSTAVTRRTNKLPLKNSGSLLFFRRLVSVTCACLVSFTWADGLWDFEFSCFITKSFIEYRFVSDLICHRNVEFVRRYLEICELGLSRILIGINYEDWDLWIRFSGRRCLSAHFWSVFIFYQNFYAVEIRNTACSTGFVIFFSDPSCI